MSSLRDSNSDSEYPSDSSEDVKDSINNVKEFIIILKSSAENCLVMDDYLPNYSELLDTISGSIISFFKNSSESF